MAFKLKSGNKTPFKAMGEEKPKETNAQYNTRVKADYQAKLQARSDSSASYQNALERNELQLDNADLWNSRNARKNILGFETDEFQFSKDERKEYSAQRREVKKKQIRLAQENFKRGIFSRFNNEEGFENTSYDTGGVGTDERVVNREEEARRLSGENVIGDRYERLLAEQESREKLNNTEEAEKLKPSDKPITEPEYRSGSDQPRKRDKKILVMNKRKLEFLPVPSQEEPKLEKASMKVDSGHMYSHRYDKKTKENIIVKSKKKIVNGVPSTSGQGEVVSVDPAWMYGTVEERRKKFNKKNSRY